MISLLPVTNEKPGPVLLINRRMRLLPSRLPQSSNQWKAMMDASASLYFFWIVFKDWNSQRHGGHQLVKNVTTTILPLLGAMVAVPIDGGAVKIASNLSGALADVKGANHAEITKIRAIGLIGEIMRCWVVRSELTISCRYFRCPSGLSSPLILTAQYGCCYFRHHSHTE